MSDTQEGVESGQCSFWILAEVGCASGQQGPEREPFFLLLSDPSRTLGPQTSPRVMLKEEMPRAQDLGSGSLRLDTGMEPLLSCR